MLYVRSFFQRCARAAGWLLFMLVALGPFGAAHALPPAPAAPPAATPDSTLVFVPVATRPRTPIGMIIQPAELAATMAQYSQRIEPARSAVRSLLSNAAGALAEVPCAVATYSTATGYDCLNRASENTYLLAIAYRLTGDPAYSTRAAAFARIWPATLTSVLPGDDQAQLDWSRLVPALIWGADLLAGAPGWGEADRQQLIGMLQQHALPLARAAAQRQNNWADAGNLLWLSIAVYAGLPAERTAAVASWKLKLDGVAQPGGAALTDSCADTDWIYGMCRDGSLTEENRRGGDGLAYNQGALSVKTVFAEIMRRQGDGSLYTYTTPRGVGLRDGWDFLAPKAVDAFAGTCSWPYTPDHCVGSANRSGWEIAYARWHAPAYLPVLAEHRPYTWSNWADPGYSTVLFANLNLAP